MNAAYRYVAPVLALANDHRHTGLPRTKLAIYPEPDMDDKIMGLLSISGVVKVVERQQTASDRNDLHYGSVNPNQAGE